MNWAARATMMLTFSVVAKPDTPAESVTICMMDQGMNLVAMSSARAKISKIFVDIGITIRWTGPSHDRCPAGSIMITFLDVEPRERPEALAYALPFEGRHIFVLINRIKNLNLGPKCVPTVLSYVVAHEIGHILMGRTCHSSKGIMKAHWTQDEYSEMFSRGLAFLPEDVVDLFAGLEHWRAQVSVTTLWSGSARRR